MLCGSPGLPCWTTVPAELTDTVPSLFIAGQWDPTALPCLVRRMFRAVRAPKLLLQVRRGDHAVANGPGSPMSLALTLTLTLTLSLTLTLTLTLTCARGGSSSSAGGTSSSRTPRSGTRAATSASG